MTTLLEKCYTFDLPLFSTVNYAAPETSPRKRIYFPNIPEIQNKYVSRINVPFWGQYTPNGNPLLNRNSFAFFTFSNGQKEVIKDVEKYYFASQFNVGKCLQINQKIDFDKSYIDYSLSNSDIHTPYLPITVFYYEKAPVLNNNMLNLAFKNETIEVPTSSALNFFPRNENLDKAKIYGIVASLNNTVSYSNDTVATVYDNLYLNLRKENQIILKDFSVNDLDIGVNNKDNKFYFNGIQISSENCFIRGTSDGVVLLTFYYI
jgi:hypothetical protein